MSARKKAAATIGASLIALSTFTAMPDAVAKSPGGGIWSHGISATKVWSDYYHKKKRHGSAVKGLYFVDSGCVAKKKWSRASAPRALWGNRSWYYFC